MTKSLFLLSFVMLCFTEGTAQTFNLGAKAGANFVVVNGDNSRNNFNLFNYHLGAVGRLGITEKFAFQPELLYSTQHYSYESLRYYMDYITVPIMADYKVVGGLSLQAGPQFAMNVKNQLKMKAGDDYPGMDRKLDNAKSLGIGIGLGMQYKLPINLFFQARYTFGLTDIYDNSNLKMGVFSLSVGYFIF